MVIYVIHMTITFCLSVNPKGCNECSMQNKDVLGLY